MKRIFRLFLRGCLPAALALSTSGCITGSPSQVGEFCYSGNQCTYIVGGGLNPWNQTIGSATADAFGNVIIPCTCGFGCPAEGFWILPNYSPGQTVEYFVTCGDPILVEWPDAWTLTDDFWSLASGNPTIGGKILVDPASDYGLPAGFGPIVTDPGFSAHVLHFDTNGMTAGLLQCTFRFNYGTVRAACVKGVNIATIGIQGTGQKFLAPLGGASLDLTALQPPDPRVICLGPDATPTRPGTWGRLKIMYR